MTEASTHQPIRIDPRVPIILDTMSALLDAPDESGLTRHISLQRVATEILQTLDLWLIDQGIQAKKDGLPMPRIYGFRFCDCTKILNELTLGTTEPAQPVEVARSGVAILSDARVAQLNAAIQKILPATQEEIDLEVVRLLNSWGIKLPDDPSGFRFASGPFSIDRKTDK